MNNLPPSQPTFWIKNVAVFGDLILAPMDGYSDSPFRALARSLGSAMSYSEFINAREVINGHPHLEKRVHFTEAERPLVIQIYDEDPERLLKAAIILQDLKPDVIDVNLGCSVRSVSGRGAGAGLLQHPEKVKRIFQILTANLSVPVTAKIRLGWDDTCRNYLEIANIIQDNGGSLIAVHGRTRSQGYTGNADWDAIAEVKQAVRIPVLGNGDVRTVEDIEEMKKHTRVDGVMIGRAAAGNPWIFSRLDREDVPVSTVRRTINLHLEHLSDFYGAKRGLVLFRKHARRYLAPYHVEKDLMTALLTEEERDGFESLLKRIFDRPILLNTAGDL